MSSDKTLTEILEEIKTQEKQLEEKKAKANVIIGKLKFDIIEKMLISIREYAITATDLGFNGKSRQGKTTTGSIKQLKGEPKYQGPNGELWSGGRGRKPGWIKAALEEGKSLAEFLIK